MTDRITTNCQHTHTVTLRLDEGDPLVLDGTQHADSVAGSTSWRGYSLIQGDAELAYVRKEVVPEPICAELEAALAAAEASCGGCGCAERLRAEAERLDAATQARYGMRSGMGGQYRMAADFLDAAPDARGSDLSAEQPATVAEQGDTKKRAEWNDPKEATDG